MNIIKTLLSIALFFSLLSCGGSSTKESQNTITSMVETNPVEETLYPDYNTNPIPADNTGMTSTAVEIASRIKLGWNIGNTMEATGGKSETYWGNPMINTGLIQLVKDHGFDAVRIPISWDQYANQETAEIDAAWLDRVKEVVQYCMENDIYVLINIHWDGGWLEENNTLEKQDENNAKQKAFWQQIATHLRDFDERLLFASANEPNVDNAEEMSVLLSYHQTFVDAVRATGGKNAYRTLVFQGPYTDFEKTNEFFNELPIDTVAERMMVEVHFYSPYNFTIMREDESWGNQFYYWGDGFHSTTDTAHNPTWGEEDYVVEMFQLIKTKYVDKGIPVVMGEFGPTRRDNLTGADLELHLASRAYYLKVITEQANIHGLMPFYWDTGGLDNMQSGIFDRSNNTVFDWSALEGLKQGAGK